MKNVLVGAPGTALVFEDQVGRVLRLAFRDGMGYLHTGELLVINDYGKVERGPSGSGDARELVVQPSWWR